MKKDAKAIGSRRYKTVKFKATNTKQEDRNGVPVGIVEGYASTYDKDRGNDIILPGSFSKTIERHRQDNRPIRMLRGHNDSKLIGGFPISEVKETDQGLFVVGEVNLDVQEGAESYALAKQGVLTDFSIGYSFTSPDDFESKEIDGEAIWEINNLELWEVSLVNEPMNASANVTSVKTVTPFQDLPLADRDRPWDSGQAEARVRAFTGSEDGPTDRYRDAFFWYDSENSGEFGAYKLPFVDVIDGRLQAVPRGIFASAAAMRGARGGVDIPDGDRAGVRAHIEQYYRKMDLPSPFNTERGFNGTFLEVCETVSDVEECLKLLDLSSKDRKKLISVIKSVEVRDGQLSDDAESGRDDDDSLDAMVKKLESLNNGIAEFSIKQKMKKL